MLRSLSSATAENIPELPWLHMQISEHLGKFFRLGRHLLWERQAARRGSVLQYLHDVGPKTYALPVLPSSWGSGGQRARLASLHRLKSRCDLLPAG